MTNDSAVGGGSERPIDLFISYRTSDLEWAQWLVHVFEELGHSTFYQDRDFGIGDSFRAAIQRGLTQSSAVVLVLSPAYQESKYTTEEWTSALQDALQGKVKVFPIRVADFKPSGLLSDRGYVDLVGRSESDAKTEIAEGLSRAKIPATAERRAGFESAPGYPARQHDVPAAPADLMGRDDELGQIDTAISKQETPVAVIPDPPDAHGRGQTGIVAEFVRRHAADFEKLCWIHADPAELLPVEFSRVGRELGLPPRRRTLESVYEELGTSVPAGKALVVFDSAPSRGELKDWLPPPAIACVLSSRSPSYTDAVRLGALTEAQSRAALAEAAHVAEDAMANASELLELNPESVALASRFLASTEYRPEQYAAMLQSKIEEIGDSPAAVRSITLDHLQQIAPDAISLLALFSFTTNRPFPLKAFEYSRPSHDSILDSVLLNADRRTTAVGFLVQFGLLHEVGGLAIVAKRASADAGQRLTDEQHRAAGEAFAELIGDALEGGVEGDPALADHIAPHAYHVTRSLDSDLPASVSEAVGLALAAYLVALRSDDLAAAELGRLPELKDEALARSISLWVELDIRSGALDQAKDRLSRQLASTAMQSDRDRRKLLMTLARVHSLSEDNDLALEALKEAWSLAGDDLARLEVLEERFHAERCASQLEAALRTASERYEKAAAFVGDDDRIALVALGDRGAVGLDIGSDSDFESARDDLAKAVEGLAGSDGDARVGEFFVDLAKAESAAGEHERARYLLGRAAMILAERQGRRSPAIARVYRRLAESYDASLDTNRAAVMSAMASELEEDGGRKPPVLDIPSPQDELLRVVQGECVPIIGPGLTDRVIGSRRAMAREWAKGYPMAPYHQEDLPHIAQYLLIRLGSPAKLRERLRSYVIGAMRGRYQQALAAATDPQHNSDDVTLLPALAAEVGRINRWIDPFEYHTVLARLKARIYITTGPSDLLADALREAGRDPTVVICNWLDSAHPGADETTLSVSPSADRPIVLHLFGNMREEGSVLLTEQDYLDFVIRYARSDSGSVPFEVERALVEKSLLFVGFDLDDWDFSVLLQAFVDQRAKMEEELPRVAVQVEAKDEWLDKRGAQDHLSRVMRTRRGTDVIFQDLDSVMIELGHALGIGS